MRPLLLNVFIFNHHKHVLVKMHDSFVKYEELQFISCGDVKAEPEVASQLIPTVEGRQL